MKNQRAKEKENGNWVKEKPKIPASHCYMKNLIFRKFRNSTMNMNLENREPNRGKKLKSQKKKKKKRTK